ncbi:MAG: DUF3494 domain-containing protein [Chitinophagaceae bacterium]|nr:DUF3494 domain-containing protein [Oligoflexus sp.]
MKSLTNKSNVLLSTLAFTLILSATMPACSSDKKDKGAAVAQVELSVTNLLTSPGNGSTNVAINSKISAIFGEAMLPSSISADSFTVTSADGSRVEGTVSFAADDAARSFTFSPSTPLSVSATYTARLTTEVKAISGAGFSAAHEWRFTTGTSSDTTAPAEASKTPLASASNVPTNRKLTVIFDEAMDPTTLTTHTFSVKNPAGVLVAGVVTYTGTTATFAPSQALQANTTYTVTMTTDVKDLAGNPLSTALVWTFTTGSVAAQGPAPVSLGTAGNFVILAKAAISTTGTTAVVGNLGLSPAAQSFMTGFSEALDSTNVFARSILVTGKMYAADMAVPTPANLTTAVSDMELAYTDAAGRKIPDFIELGAGDVSGKTMVPGLYKWGTGLLMTSDVTLAGGENDVWIFQIAQNVTIANGVHITLSGGARPSNIFWQVAGQVTLGTTSSFKGVILSQTQIVLQTGASLNGRALAQTAVTLDANAVTQPTP